MLNIEEQYKQNNKFLEDVIFTMGIFIIFGMVWMLLEFLLYGQIQNRIVDNIISFPIILSFYLNVKHYRKDKK